MDMKRRYLLYAVVAGITLCLLPGCSAVDEQGAIGETATLSINRVSVGHFPLETATRAAGGITVLKEGTVGISRASGGEARDNVPYTYGASSWTTFEENILLSETTSQMVAYYPYSASGVYTGTGSDAVLNMAPCLYEASKDLCAGVFTASATDYDPTPILSHLSARVSFRFVKQLSYEDTGVIRSFMLKDVPLTGTYGLFSRTWGWTANEAEASMNFELDNLTNVTADTDHSTIDLLLIPFGVSYDDKVFMFHVDGSEEENLYKGIIPRSLFASTDYALCAGCHYKLKVLLGDNSFAIEPDNDGNLPSVSGWNEVTLSGDYEYEVDD